MVATTIQISRSDLSNHAGAAVAGRARNFRKGEAMNNKDIKLQTFLHYSDPTARQERTVFGQGRDGLFYNYDDRLVSQEWSEGLRLASEKYTKDSARYFEAALSHFHKSQVNLDHVVLGCNLSNGFSYLIFGYTY